MNIYTLALLLSFCSYTYSMDRQKLIVLVIDARAKATHDYTKPNKVLGYIFETKKKSVTFKDVFDSVCEGNENTDPNKSCCTVEHLIIDNVRSEERISYTLSDTIPKNISPPCSIHFLLEDKDNRMPSPRQHIPFSEQFKKKSPPAKPAQIAPNVRVGVGVLIFNEQNEILLGKRKNSHGNGTWAAPGGHLEFGESLENCARREVFEETGLHVESIEEVGFTNDIFAQENKHYITLVMRCTATGTLEVKEPEKCECWQWFALDQLPNNLFIPLQNFLAKYTF